MTYFPLACRVLVVDDNRDAADTLAAVLSILGADVRACYDGPSALRVAEAFLPNAAVLDLNMPEMDGYELAWRMRAAHPHTLLVALTAMDDPESRRRTADLGFDLHLVKSHDLSDLTKLLERLTARAVGQIRPE